MPRSVTLKDIKGAEQALSKILMAQVDFKLAYRMQKISKKLVAQFEKIEDERLKLVNKFGEPELDKDKKPTGRQSVPQEKHKEFLTYGTSNVIVFTSYGESSSELSTQHISKKGGII